VKSCHENKEAPPKELTHTDIEGKARMVDVSGKKESLRTAKAQGFIIADKEIIKKIKENKLKKGDVLTVAKLGAISAAKKTSDLILLCHQIKITSVEVTFRIIDEENKIIAGSIVTGFDKTGVEMEALTSVSIALLNVYDMCKALSKEMIIGGIKLLEKTGGKSDYKK